MPGAQIRWGPEIDKPIALPASGKARYPARRGELHHWAPAEGAALLEWPAAIEALMRAIDLVDTTPQ
jgi:hypothetical protein